MLELRGFFLLACLLIGAFSALMFLNVQEDRQTAHAIVLAGAMIATAIMLPKPPQQN